MSNKYEEWRIANMSQIYMMLMELCAKFPKTFTTDEKKLKPLKIGINEDIKVVLGLKCDYRTEAKKRKRLVREALKLYTESPGYLKKLTQQLYRIDLQGKRTEKVVEEHAERAKMMLEELKLEQLKK